MLETAGLIVTATKPTGESRPAVGRTSLEPEPCALPGVLQRTLIIHKPILPFQGTRMSLAQDIVAFAVQTYLQHYGTPEQ